MKSDKVWQEWGNEDPYFGVLTDDKFRRGNIDANRQEFFASGARTVSQTLDRYRRMFGTLPSGTALDFGCGVGRLSLPLAEQFDRVIGLDIAPGMLSEAQENAKALGRTNAAFLLSDEALSNAPGEFAFVFSYIVLQHIEPTRGLSIIRLLLSKVAPGGGCMIHVSVDRNTSLKRRIGYWAKFNIPLANAANNLIHGRPVSDAPMQMNEYPLAVIVALFEASGMSEIVCVPEVHGGVMTLSMIGHKPKA